MDYFLIGLLTLLIGFGIGKFFKVRILAGMGTPESLDVDCETLTVTGVLGGTSPDQPTNYRAKVFDTCPTNTFDPSTLPAMASTAAHPDIELSAVSADAVLNDPVCIVVWAHYVTSSGNHHYMRGETNVNCGCPIGGSGNPALIAHQLSGVTPQNPTDSAPLQCTVDASGFGPSVLTSFNRAWKLVHRGSGLLWDNGGDGSREPHVELATDRPFGTPWKLTFRLGEIVVCYTKSAEEWQALAANTFRSVSTVGIAEDATLPASVTVVPA